MVKIHLVSGESVENLLLINYWDLLDLDVSDKTPEERDMITPTDRNPHSWTVLVRSMFDEFVSRSTKSI